MPGNGPALSMRGAPPPHMSHTQPMTHRSLGGGARRLGAPSVPGSWNSNMSSSSFFTRHNPHPARVRHIDGLLGVPICHVSDDGFQKTQQLRTLGTPERRSLQATYKMPQSTNEYPLYPTNSYGISDYDIFSKKGIPARRVPQLPRWFDELKDISARAGLEPGTVEQQPQKASYSKVTGRLNEAPSRAMSRTSRGRAASRGLAPQSRAGVFTGAIHDTQDSDVLILELIGQVLQTDSMSAIQSWLQAAPDSEKNAVSDMIRAALDTQNQLASDGVHYEPREETGPMGAAGGQFDRLVVDDSQRLPDINQQRSNSARLIDQVNAKNQLKLEPTIAENDEYVEYRSLQDGQQ